jgi:hypothetical protein
MTELRILGEVLAVLATRTGRVLARPRLLGAAA